MELPLTVAFGFSLCVLQRFVSSVLQTCFKSTICLNFLSSYKSLHVLFKLLPCVQIGDAQRLAAWRSGGFLAQKFIRRTALEPTTKLSYEAMNPPLRQTAVTGWRSCPMSLFTVICYLLPGCESCTTSHNFLCLSHRLCSTLLRGLRPFLLVSKF